MRMSEGSLNFVLGGDSLRERRYLLTRAPSTGEPRFEDKHGLYLDNVPFVVHSLFVASGMFD